MAAKNRVIYNKDTWPADVEAGKVIVDTMDYAGIPIASQTGGGDYMESKSKSYSGWI